MFSPLRDPAQLAASPLGAAGPPATGLRSGDSEAAAEVVPVPFAGWRASVRRALDVTVAFTTLESYTADDLLRSLAGSADEARAADHVAAARAAGGWFLDAPPTGGDASALEAPGRTAGAPRRQPAPSRARRAHAATPAAQHCITPLPGGPRAPRATPSARHAPATPAARRLG